jgi:hypothetical protein
MTDEVRDVIIGDYVTEDLIKKYRNPIVCARTSPVMEGFVPTSFNDLSSVISSVALIIPMTEKVGTVVLTPINSFRSDWKYYGVQYGLELAAEFSEVLLSQCIFVSKLNEVLGIESVTVISDPDKRGVLSSVRDDFIFEYMGYNHPTMPFRKIKI